MDRVKTEYTKHRRDRFFLAGRCLAGVVGIVFLAAGLMKATDLGLFARQIEAYGIVTDPVLVKVIAWFLIPVECGLGTALLVGYRPRWTLGLTAALLVGFVGVTSWASLVGSTENCGCFGPWMKQTPGMESVQNLVLLAMVSTAWWILSAVRQPGSWKKGVAVTAGCVLALAIPLITGDETAFKESPTAGTAAPGMFDTVDVYGHGLEYVDFSIGDNLVALIGTNCAHCRESVPRLNTLTEAPHLPDVIALCTDDEGACLEFVQELLPIFPIGHIDEDTFWRLLGDGTLPRVFLVRNGDVVHTWNESVPDVAAVSSALISSDAEQSWVDSARGRDRDAPLVNGYGSGPTG
jgi:uncharacterized membrane protein YphA (DoxX/SURF4 family)